MTLSKLLLEVPLQNDNPNSPMTVVIEQLWG
jgi:hypothetical protein